MIATCFALVAFVAAIVVGFEAGNDLTAVVYRATVVMCVCWIIGRIFGGIAEHQVNQYIRAYKEKHPIPSDDSEESEQSVKSDEQSADKPIESVSADGNQENTQQDPPAASNAAA